MHVIYTMLDDRVRYWNTCGWTQNLNKARVYTYADAKEAQSRMLADRLRVTIAPVKRT